MQKSTPYGSRQITSEVTMISNRLADAAYFLIFFTSLMMALMITSTSSVKAEDFKNKFRVADQSSTIIVDHSRWEGLLKTYVKTDSAGLNRVNYAAFRQMGRKSLKTYLADLQAVDVPKLNKNEQFAFWANLYNAQTIETILAHYPVKSIRDIDISPGLFANGPWKKKALSVNSESLSLDDIEHKILRAQFKDPRVHYAVNCASIGCPNLSTEAFTGARLEEQLDNSARAYINNPRGVKLNGKRVIASKIYKWFDEDFGNSESGVLKHVRKYADAKLARALKGVTDIYDYDYDWSLNDSRH